MWQTYIKAGDSVSTPMGDGTVRRVSQNGVAQVEIGGLLFEVAVQDIKQGSSPKGENVTLKVGQKVTDKKLGWKGEVTEVTQRTVKVKYPSGTRHYAKREAGDKLKNTPGEQSPQETQPQEPKKELEQKTERELEQDIKKTGDALYAMMQLKEHLENKIETSVDGELKELREQVKSHRKLEINIGETTKVIEGLKHKQFEQLLTYAALRMNTLLVGMAGTGKTHAGEQVADALTLDFYTMSVGAQTSKSDIIGYMDASGNYVKTHFRDAYENGGVFLMDEIDAGNSNVLIQINSALSNGLMAFPDKMVKKHDDFVFIASANTFGNGANRQYVGRNQLDAATLDRFSIIEWLIDDELEKNLSVGLNGHAWYMAVKAARDYVADKSIRALVTPRATQKGSKLLHAGQDLDEVIDATLMGSVPDDKKTDVKEVAKTVFNKFASEVPSQLSKSVNPEVSELVR